MGPCALPTAPPPDLHRDMVADRADREVTLLVRDRPPRIPLPGCPEPPEWIAVDKVGAGIDPPPGSPSEHSFEPEAVGLCGASANGATPRQGDRSTPGVDRPGEPVANEGVPFPPVDHTWIALRPEHAEPERGSPVIGPSLSGPPPGRRLCQEGLDDFA